MKKRMHRVLPLLLAAALCLNLFLMLPVTAGGEETSGGTEIGEGVTEDGLRYSYKDGLAVIMGYEGDSTNVTIPAEIDGNAVVSIGNGVFYQNSDLESVVLPDGLQSIGGEAFASCYELSSVNFPSTLEVIGANAFAHCRSLYIDLECSGIKFGEFCFRGASLRSLKLTNCLINNYAFMDIATLEHIELHSCTWGDQEPAPWGECSIGNVFSIEYVDSTALTSVVLDNVEYIPPKSFYGCTALSEVTFTGDTTVMKHLMQGAFHSCKSLTTIVLPDGTESIGQEVFQDCPSLTAVYIPASVNSIENDAFDGDMLLTIYGIKGSFAEEYADAHEIPFREGEIGALNCGFQTVEESPYEIYYVDDKAIITAYNADIPEEITIPGSLNEKTVIGIGNSVFCYS